jgi:DNA-binding transcriptional LysR family regulator
MHLRTENIEAFLRVVEIGSVSGAARCMNLSKSVISKRVSDLEHGMEVRLLYRSTRRVQPTEAGLQFYEKARGAMHCLWHAAESLAQRAHGLGGELRVVAPTSVGARWLSAMAADFAQRNPRVDLVFDLDDAVADVDGRRYDLGVLVGRLGNSALIARRLAASRRVLCCSPGYAARATLPRSLDDLGRHVCLSRSGAVPAGWDFGQDGEPACHMHASATRRYVSNSEEALRNAALRGLGLAVLPLYAVADDLAGARLVEVMPSRRPADEGIYAVYTRESARSPKVRAFAQHLQDALAEPPWERPAGQAVPVPPRPGGTLAVLPAGTVRVAPRPR